MATSCGRDVPSSSRLFLDRPLGGVVTGYLPQNDKNILRQNVIVLYYQVCYCFAVGHLMSRSTRKLYKISGELTVK